MMDKKVSSLLDERIDYFVKQCGSLRAAAKFLDTDFGYLSRVRRGANNPTDRWLKKLGLVKQITYRELKKMQSDHEHLCHCGIASTHPHVTGENGCKRRMVNTPTPTVKSKTLGCEMWDTGPGGVVTDYTLRDQRGYSQHACGCWSRAGDSTNSIGENDRAW